MVVKAGEEFNGGDGSNGDGNSDSGNSDCDPLGEWIVWWLK